MSSKFTVTITGSGSRQDIIDSLNDLIIYFCYQDEDKFRYKDETLLGEIIKAEEDAQ